MAWQGQSISLSRKQARALVYVLGEIMAPISRDKLVFLFWPDTSETTARRNLSRLLSYIRNSLPHPRIIQVDNETLRLNPALAWSDATHFMDLAGYNSPASQEAMVTLYNGLFLSGFDLPHNPEFDSWLTMQQGKYEGFYLTALRNLTQIKFSEQDYAAAIDYAQRYLAADELAEDLHQQLICLYAASGNRGAAMRQFETCTLILERELGVEPLPETRAVFDQVRSGGVSTQEALSAKPTWAVLPSLDLPMIGRQDAWDEVEGAFHQLGDGGMILISGEPGVGKSRLLQEYATSKDRLVLTGNCHASTQSLPYQPIVQALRQALTLPQLWGGIQPIWLAETGRLLPEMGDHFSDLPPLIEVEPDQAQARLYEGLTRAFLGLARNASLLLCLDDLQWVDDATAGWLNYLSSRLSGSGLFVLATYRIEDKDVLAGLRGTFSRLNLLAEITLLGLSMEAIRDMLTGLPAPLAQPKVLAERIRRATGGNSFFVLETIRSLLEGDLLAAPPSELPLPGTVQSAIHGRLERLSQVARQLLEAAAVLSPDLNFKLLQETAGRSELEAADGMDELVDHRLLTVGDPYRFKHDLIHQVVYLDLTPWRRQLLHRRAGDALGEMYARNPETVAVQMAQHYDAAGASVQAIGSYQLAAVNAQQLYAHEEAIAHLQRAIELSAEVFLEITLCSELHESLADNFIITGHFAPAEQAYRSSLSLTDGTDRLRPVELQRKIAETLLPQNRAEEAISLYREALGSMMEETGAAHKQVRLRVLLGLLDALYWEHQAEAMAEVNEQARVLLDEVGTAVQKSQFYHRLEQMALLQERFQVSAQTVSLARTTLDYAQETRDIWHIARSQFGYGFKLLWHGDLESAEKIIKLGLASAEQLGDLWLQTQCLSYLTILYRLRGDTRQMNKYLPQLVQASAAVDSIYYQAVTQANTAWLYYRDGKLPSALEMAQTALATWGDASYPFRWLAHWILLAIYLDRDQLDQAVESASALLDPKQQRLPDDITAALEKVLGSWEAGKVETTRKTLKKALELARQRGYL